MNCKNCGQKLTKVGEAYTHKNTGLRNCETIVAEPEHKEVASPICKDWGNCIHGAGCTLSTFNFENEPKEDPKIIIENGILYCKTWKKG